MTDKKSILPTGQVLYPISEMASFIASRVRQTEETPRQAKDKIRKRIVYAVKHGELAQIGGAVPTILKPEQDRSGPDIQGKPRTLAFFLFDARRPSRLKTDGN